VPESRDDPAAERTDTGLPVRLIPGDTPAAPPSDGLGLCLSGGGYRAMLFHLGSLWRLNQLGYLSRLDRVSSVSGGSIVAAVLGSRWGRLGFDGDGVAGEFERQVVDPVRALAGRTVDARAIALGLLAPGSIGDRLASAYRRHLFNDATLQDLPAEGEGPRFVLNATNLQSGALWLFSRREAVDHRVGRIEEPTIPLAAAVAASSAFPPVLAPVRLRFAAADYVPGSGKDLQRPPFTTRPTLADGGVYDNLGLETAWKKCLTVLISDAGGAFTEDEGRFGPFDSWRWRGWGTQTVRVLKTVDNQVRELRKRQLIDGFEAEPGGRLHRKGTYWGIRSHVADYELADSLAVTEGPAETLADIPTRLAALDSATQERLINWGYAICDAALRKHCAGLFARVVEPEGLPYPAEKFGP
jgi:NTE family protein